MLISRCEYFKNMFSLKDEKNYDFKISSSSINSINSDSVLKLDIENHSRESIQEFLNFIYTAEKPSRDVNKLIELFQLSDDYCINSLKKYCELQLTMNINSEIAVDLLLLAYKNNSVILENKIIDFIGSNMKSNDMIKKSLKKLINYPSLMLKITKFQSN